MSLSTPQMSLLAKSPFVNVEGLINPRDLNDGSLESMKRGLAYRSGSLEVMSSKGTQQLQALGIKKIIDLRSAEEISAFPDPAIAGIEVDAANINRKWNRNESDTGAGKVGGNVVWSGSWQRIAYTLIWRSWSVCMSR